MDGRGSRPPRSQTSGVRVVAKFMDQGAEVQNSYVDPTLMSVSFSEEGHAFVSVSIDARNTRSAERSIQQLDYCYEEEKKVEEIYQVEVRPLVQRLFNGTNCCVISYGAHQSWPTQLFEGSGGNPSLVELTMLEILHRDGIDIEVSEYEVFQDQIYDLLDSKEKGVQLKGLSKVKVNTIDEFKSNYFQNHRLTRGHRGIIIYTSQSSKLNFLSLGGYGGATENKSLYAVMKIIYALNSRNFISYRDSRLTYQLQDFLSLDSGSVVITCLSRNNSQQNKHALMLASSSSKVANQFQFNTIRRPINQYVTPMERRYSMAVTQTRSLYEKVNKCASVRSSVKKPGLVKERVGTAKSIPTLSVDKNLFNDAEIENSISQQNVDNEESAESGITHAPNLDIQQEDLQGESAEIQEATLSGVQQEDLQGELTEIQEATLSGVQQEMVDIEELAESETTNALNLETQQEDISGASEEQKCKAVVEETSSNHMSEDFPSEEEHMTPARLTESSPKVSDLLREVSNSLKFMPNSEKHSCIGTPKRVNFSSGTFEVKTPNNLSSLGFRDSALQFADIPQEPLMVRTAGMKKSLQRECLTYINSANKDDLKRLKGIGEVRANRILQLRDNNPEPFKKVEDLKNIGITHKQFDKMMLNFLEDC